MRFLLCQLLLHRDRGEELLTSRVKVAVRLVLCCFGHQHQFFGVLKMWLLPLLLCQIRR